MDTQQKPQQPQQQAQREQPRQQQQQQPPQQPPQQSQQRQQEQPRSPFRNWIYLVLFVGLLIWNVILFWPQGQPSSITVPYSTFLAQVQAGNVREVSIQGSDIKGAFVQAVPGSIVPAAPATPGAQGTASAGKIGRAHV